MANITRFPLVTLQVPHGTYGAAWAGKWHLNIPSEAVVALGGPWDTETDAITAVIETGRWRMRENCPTAHFDPVTL